MSLTRTALRLTAVEALNPTGAQPTDLPTIAGRNVLDSQMDPFDDLAPKMQRPHVVVYTEEDSATSGQTRGGPPFLRTASLVFELSVVAMAELPNEPNKYAPAVPVTDPETEAALDLLEAGIRYALIYGPTGALFRKLTGSRIVSIDSVAHRSSEESIRLAMRTVTFRVIIPDDCFDLSPKETATGLDRLPEPLRSVILGLPPEAYGKAIGTGLAPFAPKIAKAVPLSKVGLSVDVNDDGTADIAGSVTIPQD